MPKIQSARRESDLLLSGPGTVAVLVALSSVIVLGAVCKYLLKLCHSVKERWKKRPKKRRSKQESRLRSTSVRRNESKTSKTREGGVAAPEFFIPSLGKRVPQQPSPNLVQGRTGRTNDDKCFRWVTHYCLFWFHPFLPINCQIKHKCSNNCTRLLTKKVNVKVTWLWRWLPQRLSKCQSPTTVLFRTPVTQVSYHFQSRYVLVMSNGQDFVPTSDKTIMVMRRLWCLHRCLYRSDCGGDQKTLVIDITSVYKKTIGRFLLITSVMQHDYALIKTKRSLIYAAAPFQPVRCAMISKS